MALEDGVVSYWKLNEASGNRADTFGTNTLQEEGGTVGSSATAKFGNSAFTTGVGSFERLRITDANQVGLESDNFSVQIWIYPTATAVADVFLSKGNDGFPGMFYLTTNLGNTVNARWRFRGGDNGGDLWDMQTADPGLGAPIAINTWYHIVGTRTKGGQARLYVDGSLHAFFGGANNATMGNTADFSLGSTTSSTFTGLSDEVVYWNRELTAPEVTQLYNSGAGVELTPPSISQASSLFMTGGW